ncbi:MAG: hypothetical protein AAGF25_00560, partial [Pseudomonadota bacterium]
MNKPAGAHHASVSSEYLTKHPGLQEHRVFFPFRKAAPKTDFTEDEITAKEMLVCDNDRGVLKKWEGLHEGKRRVKLTISSSLELTESSVNGLGYVGLQYAWKTCPAADFNRPAYHGVEIEIWQDGRMIYHYARSSPEDPLYGEKVGIRKLWSVWDEERAQKRAEEEIAERERQMLARKAERMKKKAEIDAFWNTFWFRFKLIVVFVGGGWVWFKYHGPIMAFYYENFTKNPVETLVKEQLRTGRKLDGESLAHELDRATRTSNAAEAKVRAKQAEKFAEQASEKAKVYKAHEDLADAMIDVERARRAEKR